MSTPQSSSWARRAQGLSTAELSERIAVLEVPKAESRRSAGSIYALSLITVFVIPLVALGIALLGGGALGSNPVSSGLAWVFVALAGGYSGSLLLRMSLELRASRAKESPEELSALQWERSIRFEGEDHRYNDPNAEKEG